MSVVLVEYKKSNVHQFPLSWKKSLEAGKPEGNITTDVLKIIPGVNSVSDKNFAIISQLDDFQKMVDDGVINVLGGKNKDGAPKKMDDLSGIEAKEACRIVSKTYNVELLKSWHDDEKRKDVKRALEKQIKEMTKGE